MVAARGLKSKSLAKRAGPGKALIVVANANETARADAAEKRIVIGSGV